MGRLRAYFDQLAHPMQDVHSGRITRACCRAAYEDRPRGVLFCPLNRGKSGAARIGGGERSEPISRMLIIPYDIESQSRNADFMLIAREGDTTTLGAEGPVKLKNPPAVRPVNPKNLPL